MMPINIHNYTYKIHLVDEHNKNLIMDDETHCGVTNFITKDIYIRNDLNDDS